MTDEIKSRASIEQMMALNAFLKQDMQLLSGKFSSTFTYKTAQNRWKAIADNLNAMPGSVKDWKKWRKTFQDNRTKTKSKKSALQTAQRKTGFNTPCIPLTQLENDTLDLINPTAISGHTGSEESKVLFTFNVDTDENIIMMNQTGTESTELLTESTPILNMFSGDISMSPSMFSLSENGSATNDELDLSVPCKPTTSKIDKKVKPKRSSAAKRLTESNDSASRLVSLGQKKFIMKSKYNRAKLAILQEKNNILARIATAIENKMSS